MKDISILIPLLFLQGCLATEFVQGIGRRETVTTTRRLALENKNEIVETNVCRYSGWYWGKPECDQKVMTASGAPYENSRDLNRPGQFSVIDETSVRQVTRKKWGYVAQVLLMPALALDIVTFPIQFVIVYDWVAPRE